MRRREAGVGEGFCEECGAGFGGWSVCDVLPPIAIDSHRWENVGRRCFARSSRENLRRKKHQMLVFANVSIPTDGYRWVFGGQGLKAGSRSQDRRILSRRASGF